jgi:glyoxylase-like metal-dependent hydrolase (beta-lactamase superfamily II)
LEITKSNLDYVLLTHIHIDHAGGVGVLLRYFPEAQVICHPRGIKHLINPEKLWNASKKVLGDIAEMYGEIYSVPENRIQFLENISGNKVKAIEALGHAPHHLVYLFKNYLFIGDTAGVSFPLTNNIYLRPATPPIFDYDITLSTFEKLIALNLIDYKICYGHYGIRDNAHLMLKIAKEQLTIWKEVVESLYDRREQNDFVEIVITELLKEDKYFASMNLFNEDVRNREKTFVLNSIKGILGYIQKKRNN